MSRPLKPVATLESVDTVWVLLSPQPQAEPAICILRSTGDRFETDVTGLDGPVRWGYHSREAALAGARRFQEQLQSRGWRPQ